MFCDDCKYKAYSGNSDVCGYYLHGGETVYIDDKVYEWCPCLESNTKYNTALERNRRRSAQNRMILNQSIGFTAVAQLYR